MNAKITKGGDLVIGDFTELEEMVLFKMFGFNRKGAYLPCTAVYDFDEVNLIELIIYLPEKAGVK